MKYTKRPITIEASQFVCELPHSGPNVSIKMPGTFMEYPIYCDEKGAFLLIPTKEGTMRANTGDWIITGIQGERYPCKPDIFEATYTRTPSKEAWQAAMTLFLTPSTTDAAEIIAAEFAPIVEDNENVRKMLVEAEGVLVDVHQVFEGWHADGTCWSEWDQSVHDRANAIHRLIYAALNPPKI